MRIKFNKEIRGRGSERREPTRLRQREICRVNRQRTVCVCEEVLGGIWRVIPGRGEEGYLPCPAYQHVLPT